MKKNILLLINQNEINNVIEIAKRIETKFKLIFFITDIFSSYDYLRKNYNVLKTKFPKSEIYDYYNELKFLNKEKKKYKVDFKFLKEFESKLYSKSLIQNFLKDIELNNLYGNRKITYHPNNKKIYYELINFISKKINSLFLKRNIYFVYSPDTINFTRNTILEICIIKKIPFYWVSYRIFNFLFLINLSDKKNFTLMRKGIKKINTDKIKKGIKILTNAANVIEEKEKLISFKKFFQRIIKLLFHNIKNFKNNYINYRKQRYSNIRPNYFGNRSTLNCTWYWLRQNIKAYFIQKYCLISNSEKLNKIKKCNFIFYPLHVTPEAGVYDQSELYDQLFLIQKISKLLPVDTFLVVKTHPSNFKENTDIEDLNWYKSINKIYNVILLSHHINPLYLIKKSIGVISVSGSACLEANLMKKPSFLIGNTEFSGLYGVYNFNKNFMNDIKNFNEKKLYLNNFYFNYIMNESIEMHNYKYADFIYPIENSMENGCKNAFNYFSNKLLNT
jgi:hypothetical protein